MEKQDMQQIIKMLEKLVAKQEKAAANRKADKEEMEADMKAWQEEMAAERRAIQARTEDTQAEMEEMACRETTKAHSEEKNPTSADMKPEMTQDEKVPAEVATVMLVVETEEETSNTRKETMACQEMEERLEEEEPTSVDRKPEVAQQ
jgi:hypothetical protein